MAINKNVRNVAIVLIIAALVVLLPGGGKGATVATQAISLAFLASIAWVASLMYREHRTAIYSLGETRRAILYAAIGVAAITLTATQRMWNSAGGEIAWFVLMGGAIYAVVAIVLQARKY